MTSRPRITIIRHRRERPEKCSLTPLDGLEGTDFFVYPTDEPDVHDHVRLGFEGPPLTRHDRDRSILVLDATWRLVAPMERRYRHVEPRSLPAHVPPIRTAYPRVGKLTPDPDGGLASVEALAAALRALGRDHRPILASYRWADAFLAINAAFFGCGEPSDGASSSDPHGTRPATDAKETDDARRAERTRGTVYSAAGFQPPSGDAKA